MFSKANYSLELYVVIGTILILFLVFFIVFFIIIHGEKLKKVRLNAIRESEDAERNRLAIELHDGIGAKLSGLKMNIEFLISTTKEEEQLAIIKTTVQNMNDVIDELRNISHNLKLSVTNTTELLREVNSYLVQLNMNKKCKYELLYELSDNSVPQAYILPIYRMLSELVTNIAKHSMATEALIQVFVFENTLQIIVEDNGVGITKSKLEVSGIGLNNIQERVSSLKGRIEIDSTLKGTVVIIHLPL